MTNPKKKKEQRLNKWNIIILVVTFINFILILTLFINLWSYNYKIKNNINNINVLKEDSKPYYATILVGDSLTFRDNITCSYRGMKTIKQIDITVECTNNQEEVNVPNY